MSAQLTASGNNTTELFEFNLIDKGFPNNIAKVKLTALYTFQGDARWKQVLLHSLCYPLCCGNKQVRNTKTKKIKILCILKTK